MIFPPEEYDHIRKTIEQNLESFRNEDMMVLSRGEDPNRRRLGRYKGRTLIYLRGEILIFAGFNIDADAHSSITPVYMTEAGVPIFFDDGAQQYFPLQETETIYDATVFWSFGKVEETKNSAYTLFLGYTIAEILFAEYGHDRTH